jgi:nucleoside-diphosphate-sugar epimerase
MRVLVTGAGGLLGHPLLERLSLRGHIAVAADVVPVPAVPTRSLDVRDEGEWRGVLDDIDTIVHLPAWHGIHVDDHDEREFWELNVHGTHLMLQAARAAGVRRVVWLSSQSWHERYEVYGFTKRVGEELLRYHRHRHGLSFVALRPASFVSFTDEVHDYGRGLLYERVDQDDVLEAVVLAVEALVERDLGLVVDVLHPDSIAPPVLERWERDPLAAVEEAFPGARSIVQQYGIDIRARPPRPTTTGWAELGYQPSRDFGTFLRALAVSNSLPLA